MILFKKQPFTFEIRSLDVVDKYLAGGKINNYEIKYDFLSTKGFSTFQVPKKTIKKLPVFFVGKIIRVFNTHLDLVYFGFVDDLYLNETKDFYIVKSLPFFQNIFSERLDKSKTKLSDIVKDFNAHFSTIHFSLENQLNPQQDFDVSSDTYLGCLLEQLKKPNNNLRFGFVKGKDKNQIKMTISQKTPGFESVFTKQFLWIDELKQGVSSNFYSNALVNKLSEPATKDGAFYKITDLLVDIFGNNFVNHFAGIGRLKELFSTPNDEIEAAGVFFKITNDVLFYKVKNNGSTKKTVFDALSTFQSWLFQTQDEDGYHRPNNLFLLVSFNDQEYNLGTDLSRRKYKIYWTSFPYYFSDYNEKFVLSYKQDFFQNVSSQTNAFLKTPVLMNYQLSQTKIKQPNLKKSTYNFVTLKYTVTLNNTTKSLKIYAYTNEKGKINYWTEKGIFWNTKNNWPDKTQPKSLPLLLKTAPTIEIIDSTFNDPTKLRFGSFKNKEIILDWNNRGRPTQSKILYSNRLFSKPSYGGTYSVMPKFYLEFFETQIKKVLLPTPILSGVLDLKEIELPFTNTLFAYEKQISLETLNAFFDNFTYLTFVSQLKYSQKKPWPQITFGYFRNSLIDKLEIDG